VIQEGSKGLGTTGGIFALCHDDGSAYYVDEGNFLVYAGMKNYKGHENQFIGNLVVMPDSQPNIYPECFAEQAEYRDSDDDSGDHGLNDVFRNNTCIMQGDNWGVASFGCSEAGWDLTTMAHSTDNSYYNPSGEAVFECGADDGKHTKVMVVECPSSSAHHRKWWSITVPYTITQCLSSHSSLAPHKLHPSHPHVYPDLHVVVG
jgi:hypothetical protein